MDGLKVKYDVFKVDDGSSVYNCFVLRPYKDKAAIEALKRYAEVTDNRILAKDIKLWIECIERTNEILDCARCIGEALGQGIIAGEAGAIKRQIESEE
jgi:hypothetical protein